MLGYYYLLPYIFAPPTHGFSQWTEILAPPIDILSLRCFSKKKKNFALLISVQFSHKLLHVSQEEAGSICSGREWWSFTKFINCTRTLKLWFLMAHQFVINFTHDFTSFYPKSDAFVNILCYLDWSSCLTVPDLIQVHRHLLLLLGYICFFLLLLLFRKMKISNPFRTPRNLGMMHIINESCCSTPYDIAENSMLPRGVASSSLWATISWIRNSITIEWIKTWFSELRIQILKLIGAFS